MASLSRGKLAALLAAAALAAAYGIFRYANGANDAVRYKLAPVESGPLVAVVSATGTLSPVVSVQVGSQVSGQIKEIYVDFNTPVKAGQLIARIDPETFQHRLRQAQADLEASRAAVLTQQAAVAASRAELARIEANLREAERDYERKKQLVEKNFIAGAERDKAEATLQASRAQRDAARAQVRVAESQAHSGEAVVKQREAQVAQARVDLERTAIRAPVDGVVVKRSVEPGQTVAASLQAPELFVIARNLTDMQVETAIDEADVGRIREGQKAHFTVDAFPERQFEGTVRQVRKAAQVVSNVVTYTVVISADNADLSLLPGMTANVRIVTARKDKVLKVPNAALRFKPPEAEEKPAAGRPGRPSGTPGSRLWVLDARGKPQPITVKFGLSDGRMTEIVSGEVDEGMQVIVGTAGPLPRRQVGPRFL
ncbi:MAG: efflux RND transporter periplasmic adaptor subunit [Pseudomonadota bacterium]|jgi:HlyD family secretion protein